MIPADKIHPPTLEQSARPQHGGRFAYFFPRIFLQQAIKIMIASTAMAEAVITAEALAGGSDSGCGSWILTQL